jgi:hypothetical protein
MEKGEVTTDALGPRVKGKDGFEHRRERDQRYKCSHRGRSKHGGRECERSPHRQAGREYADAGGAALTNRGAQGAVFFLFARCHCSPSILYFSHLPPEIPHF